MTTFDLNLIYPLELWTWVQAPVSSRECPLSSYQSGSTWACRTIIQP